MDPKANRRGTIPVFKTLSIFDACRERVPFAFIWAEYAPLSSFIISRTINEITAIIPNCAIRGVPATVETVDVVAAAVVTVVAAAVVVVVVVVTVEIIDFSPLFKRIFQMVPFGSIDLVHHYMVIIAFYAI